jgi:hypothetical protein
MGHKPATRVEAALYQLCLYGFCLPPSDQEALLADPPRGELGTFVDAVLVAEGFPTAELCEARIVSTVTGIVRDWLFDEGQGKGTSSGLPLTPGDNSRAG